jgi:hypothetical protein
MPEVLALTGLVIATLLYALLVRRRSIVRTGVESLGRAMSASNQIALARLSRGFRAETSVGAGADAIVIDRRSGTERRRLWDRRRGRGRRSGGDRRRGASSA